MISYEEWREHPYIGETFQNKIVELTPRERICNADSYRWISYNKGKNNEYSDYVAMYTNRNRYFC